MMDAKYIILIVSLFLFTACSSPIAEVEDVVRSDPVIREYLLNNPDAKVTLLVSPPEDHPDARTAVIQNECGDDFDPNGYHYVVVSAATADHKIVAFVDPTEIVCLMEIPTRSTQPTSRRTPISCSDPDVCNSFDNSVVSYEYDQGGQTMTGTFTDICKDEETLLEGRCNGNRLMEAEVYCKHGCDNGVCLSAPMPRTNVTDPIKKVENVSYGPDERQKFDIFYREDFVDAPMIMLVHGAGWAPHGDKERMHKLVAFFSSRGFIVVTPNYRRTTIDGQNVFPSLMKDVACAAATAKQQIGQYGGNGSKLFLGGNSVGAHTTAMITYDSESDWLEGCAVQEELDVLGFVGGVGSYDFVAIPHERWQVGCYLQDLLDIECGGCADIMESWVGADPALWAPANPINHVSAGDPPAILIAGEDDCFSSIVNPSTGKCTENAERMAQVMEDNGVYVDLLIMPGYGHEAFSGGLYDGKTDIQERLQAFLDGALAGTLQ